LKHSVALKGELFELLSLFPLLSHLGLFLLLWLHADETDFKLLVIEPVFKDELDHMVKLVVGILGVSSLDLNGDPGVLAI